MSLLLDTHAFIWWRTNDPRIGAPARQAIARTAKVYVSVASAWEVAIKVALGKLRLSENFEAGVEQSGFDKLGIKFAHAELVARLPLHHGDPFDRMLVAQALVEGLALVTRDERLQAYGVSLVWS